MKSQARFWMVVILASASAGACLLWAAQLIWHRAGELDRNSDRFGVKSQLMRRKSEAMHDILDEMVTGNLRRVHSAANRMERYGETIDGYLASELYDEYGADFHQAVADLTAAAVQEDVDNAKEAALRLEQSCIECHMLLNRRRAEREQTSKVPPYDSTGQSGSVRRRTSMQSVMSAKQHEADPTRVTVLDARSQSPPLSTSAK